MRVTFSPRALRELASIRTAIAQDSPSAASKVVARIERLASLLADQPGLGRETEEPPVRVLPLPEHPYLLFYAVRGSDEIRVLRIRHEARQRRRP